MKGSKRTRVLRALYELPGTISFVNSRAIFGLPEILEFPKIRGRNIEPKEEGSYHKDTYKKDAQITEAAT